MKSLSAPSSVKEAIDRVRRVVKEGMGHDRSAYSEKGATSHIQNFKG